MARFVCLLFVLLCWAMQCEARGMSRCQLVRQLRKHRFPENKLRDWVCLVESESSRRTYVIGKPNNDGSRDHGLFQINDKYWCSNTKTPGNQCHVTCASVRSKHIGRAASCVKKIFKAHGFQGWTGWVAKCQGKALPDISRCR